MLDPRVSSGAGIVGDASAVPAFGVCATLGLTLLSIAFVPNGSYYARCIMYVDLGIRRFLEESLEGFVEDTKPK